MVKRCRCYFKVSKLGYMKSYEGVANDMNICLSPLTTDQHVLNMVQAARANGTHMFQGSIRYLIKQFRDLFDGFLI